MELLGEGSTVPFIARYRKEKTGGLDDTQLRKLEERLGYLRELEDRRATVLKSIEEQGKLTPELSRSINGAETKVELEDLYAPYKPKRRTKAQIAREAGLEPLGEALLANPALDPAGGGRQVCRRRQGRRRRQGGARRRAPHPDRAHRRDADAASAALREWQWGEGVLKSKVQKGKAEEGAKFSDYFEFGQPHQGDALASGARHAARRATRACSTSISTSRTRTASRIRPRRKIKVAFGIADRGRPADAWLAETVRLAWKAKLALSLQSDLLARLKERADTEAISRVRRAT